MFKNELNENKKTISLKEVKEKLYVDSYSKKGDIITVRNSYFYTLGKTTQTLIDAVMKSFPNAIIIESGNRFKTFRGGDTVSQGSHWFVKFTV